VQGVIAVAASTNLKKRLHVLGLNLLRLAAILVSLRAPALGQAASDPWLILASGKEGSINLHTTREDLVRFYGDSNVVDHDADVGDGEMEPETVLFPNDPERRIEILWRDLERRADPSSVAIRGKVSRLARCPRNFAGHDFVPAIAHQRPPLSVDIDKQWDRFGRATDFMARGRARK